MQFHFLFAKHDYYNHLVHTEFTHSRAYRQRIVALVFPILENLSVTPISSSSYDWDLRVSSVLMQQCLKTGVGL
jgi:hypothetical protein